MTPNLLCCGLKIDVPLGHVGKLLLHKELIEKGIDDSDIENALSAVEELPDALQLVYSKLSKYDGLSSDIFRNKIWSLLGSTWVSTTVLSMT